MLLKFTKMHGLGNDFMVVDGIAQSFDLTREQIKQLAHRNFGIGFDQLLLIERSNIADFKYRIFNADGGEVEQCGNGARCFVRFVVDKGFSQKHEIVVETRSGLLMLTLQDNGLVTVNMGAPEFNPSEIPFLAKMRQDTYILMLDNQTITISAVSMGNPHAVTLVDDIEAANVAELGPQIESHANFPQHVNAGFMQIVNLHEIKLRVYERGSGETLACGTGACAAVVCGIQLGLLQSPVIVHMRGGQLNIAWHGVGQNVMMTGPATAVFEGEILIN